jgi:hypothetical protein
MPMVQEHEAREAVAEESGFASHAESAAPGKAGRGRRILVVSRDPVAREFLAVICEANGYQVDEASTASKARPHRDALRQRSGPRAERCRGAGPLFACEIGLRPFFIRCPELLRELGATKMATLVLIVGERSGKAPAELETTEAVTVLVRPFEDDAIIPILKGLMGRLPC